MSKTEKSRLSKEHNICQSIKLNTAFLLEEQKDKFGIVTFSKADRVTAP